MMINTKTIRNIPLSPNMADKMSLIHVMKKNYTLLEEEFDKLFSEYKWIKFNDDKFYFIPEDAVIVVNPNKVRLEAQSFKKMLGLKWMPMTGWIAKKWFYEFKNQNPLINNSSIEYIDSNEIRHNVQYVYCYDIKRHMALSDGTMHEWSITDTDGIKIPIYKLDVFEKSNILYFFIKNKWNIFDDKYISDWFYLFESLSQRGLLVYETEDIIFNIMNCDDVKYVQNEMMRLGLEYNLNNQDYIELFVDDDNCLDDNILFEIKKELLECDKNRVNMESYPEHILTDPESGHWDLWENGNSEVNIHTDVNLVARNPVYDALTNKSGIIGIDFGTKSTVVTYRQSTADILPMRIGSGQFSRVVSRNDYENPTVMELRNIEKFMNDYNQFIGRPNTCWEDLLISHEASEQLKSEQSKGDTFASFFTDLKQWASDKSKQVRLRDLRGKEVNIPAYLNLSENDFDPIEIYAYYLGLFINNMVHKIYLRYKLSFPATVEKKVRDKILNSFSKGIKKSLPSQVLEDSTCMKIFKVEQGTSEPAAYAITALYGYGFEPEEKEKHYYGIFDFGGGTTDFDFGVWSSELDEPENYDYQISHFGQGGDPYLGGENLLEILSYKVFINNYDKLLKDRIVFIRPSGEKAIAGKDYLVCQDSQYAHFNQKRMMEKLRGVWEGNKEIREQFQSGSITLPLFNMDGESKDNYSVDVDLEELDYLLEYRIDKGVAQFFDAMKNCFGVTENQKDLHDVNGINIFLAGNSSKSPLVYKVFKKYIDLYKDGLSKGEEHNTEWFRLFPPLGTSVSDAILKGNINPFIDEIITYIKDEKQYNEDESFNIDDLNKPTGKTGVAYGLLNNRVRVVQNETEEIPFRYYIGQNRKNKFYCVIDKDIHKYDEWIRFCTASREEFDIWFTRSSAAPSNKMLINQIGVYSEIGFVAEPSTDKAVYIKLVSPTEIEYVVANEEELTDLSYINDNIERIALQEKH